MGYPLVLLLFRVHRRAHRQLIETNALHLFFLLCKHSKIQRSSQKYITDIKQTKLKRQTVDWQRQQRLLSSKKVFWKKKKSDHSAVTTVIAMISFIVKPVQQQWYWPLFQDKPSTIGDHILTFLFPQSFSPVHFVLYDMTGNIDPKVSFICNTYGKNVRIHT